MSVTAGFDLAIEIAGPVLRSIVLNQVQDVLPVRGPRALGPVPFSLPLPTGGSLAAQLYTVLRTVAVAVIDTGGVPTLRLTIKYDTTSVIAAALPQPVCALAGEVVVAVPIAFGASPGSAPGVTVNQAAADLTAATVSNTFANPEIINKQIAGGAEPASTAFADGLKAMLTLLAPAGANAGRLTVGPAIPVAASGEGSLSPLVATALQLRAVGGGIVLFMNLNAATRTAGNPADKTALSLPAGRTFALSLTPGAFHRQIFCPGIATSFNAPVAALPTSCGGAGSLSFVVPGLGQSVDVTELRDTFEEGRIRVDAKFSKSVPCVSFKGSLVGQLTFPQGVTPKFDVVDAQSDIDTAWYCEIAAALVGLLTAGAAFTLSAAFGVTYVEGAVEQFIDSYLKSGFAGLQLPTSGLDASLFGGGSLSEVKVSTEGLSLFGSLPQSVPTYDNAEPSFTLTTVYDTISSDVIETGTVTMPAGLLCGTPSKSYPFTLRRVAQRASVGTTAKWVSLPLSAVEWRVLVPNASNTASDVYPLSGSGTLALKHLEVSVPDPGGSVTLQDQTVSVGYACSDTGVTFTNVPGDKGSPAGSFAFFVEGSVTACGGAGLSAQAMIHFDGLELFVEGLAEDQDACAAQQAEFIKGRTSKLWVAHVTLLEKVDHPAPEDFRAGYEAVLRYGGDRAAALATLVRTAHANTMARTAAAASARRFAPVLQTSDAAQRATVQTAVSGFVSAVVEAQVRVDTAQAELATAQLALRQVQAGRGG